MTTARSRTAIPPWAWLLAALSAAALVIAIVALVRGAAHDHDFSIRDDRSAATDAGDVLEARPKKPGRPKASPAAATKPSRALAKPEPLSVAAYLEACGEQDARRDWPATWGEAGKLVRDTLNAAWALTPPPELAGFHARRLQALAMVLAFVEAQDYEGPLTEEAAAVMVVPWDASAQLRAFAVEDLDAGMRARIVAAGCWASNER